MGVVEADADVVRGIGAELVGAVLQGSQFFFTCCLNTSTSAGAIRLSLAAML
ncbi:MAG: hypothetical protein IPG69_07355 [Flavobacteriales bacterium]|nr:hypothetical protein [Flavobacteriales bacterium]